MFSVHNTHSKWIWCDFGTVIHLKRYLHTKSSFWFYLIEIHSLFLLRGTHVKIPTQEVRLTQISTTIHIFTNVILLQLVTLWQFYEYLHDMYNFLHLNYWYTNSKPYIRYAIKNYILVNSSLGTTLGRIDFIKCETF